MPGLLFKEEVKGAQFSVGGIKMIGKSDQIGRY